MTSAINTGTINVNYPTPGVNNNSQGLRNNFTGTKDNLDIAATEITELQSKVLLKSALTGQTLNNDMNNGIIKNVQTLGFRASTYNLGTNSGTMNIDLTLGDVQYATLAGDTSLTFSKWAPENTQSSVQVILTVVAGQVIRLPYNSAVPPSTPTGVIYGTSTVEGYSIVGSDSTITVGQGITRLHFEFTSIDCGTTIEIVPIDRPRVATQVKTSVAPSLADVTLSGTITSSTSSTLVTGVGTFFTSELTTGRVITDSAGTVIGTVAAIASNTSLALATNALIVLSSSVYKGQNIPVGQVGDIIGDIRSDGDYIYLAVANYNGLTAIWKRTPLSGY